MVGNECSIRQTLTSRRQDFNSAKDKGVSAVEVIWWFDDWWLVCVERSCSGLKRSCFSHCYSNSYRDKTFIRFSLHPQVWLSSRHLLDFSTATYEDIKRRRKTRLPVIHKQKHNWNKMRYWGKEILEHEICNLCCHVRMACNKKLIRTSKIDINDLFYALRCPTF